MFLHLWTKLRGHFEEASEIIKNKKKKKKSLIRGPLPFTFSFQVSIFNQKNLGDKKKGWSLGLDELQFHQI